MKIFYQQIIIKKMKNLILLFLLTIVNQLFTESHLTIENIRDPEGLYFQEIIKDTLIITNESNMSISIKGIGLSCGCTVISETQFDIAPNSKKLVPFTVDLTKSKNGKSININILTSLNDTIHLNYQYTVKELLIIEPQFISITSPNEFLHYEFDLINTSDNELVILNATSDAIEGENLDIEISNYSISPGETIKAKIEVEKLSGDYVGKLDIEYKNLNGLILNKYIDYIIKKGK